MEGIRPRSVGGDASKPSGSFNEAGSDGTLSTNSGNSTTHKATAASNRQTSKQRHRQKTSMAFERLVAGTSPQTSPNRGHTSQNTPPRNFTPPHLRLDRNCHSRTFSSPTWPSVTDRPAVPMQRRQISNSPPGASQQQQQSIRRQNQNQSPQIRGFGRGPRKARNPRELRIRVTMVPNSWTTLDIHNFFERFGNVTRIETFSNGTVNKDARVSFMPAPNDISWVGGRVSGIGPDGVPRELDTEDKSFDIQKVRSINDTKHLYPEQMDMDLVAVGFGFMQQEDTWQAAYSAHATDGMTPQLAFDVQSKALFITFCLGQRSFKMRVNPAQVLGIDMILHPDNTTSFLLNVDMPPLFFRKLSDAKVTHREGSTLWDERQTWLRQTDIDLDPTGRKLPVELRKKKCLFDIGRCLTYMLTFSSNVYGSSAFHDIYQALLDHNVAIHTTKDFKIGWEFQQDPDKLWHWLDAPIESKADASSSLAELEHMAQQARHLEFPVRYQLEVCLSRLNFHESNIDRDFINRLASMDAQRAVKVLEKVADSKVRYYQPHDIFRLQNQVSVVQKKRPGYCTKILSASMTPSTIYFATPVLETSNRVIRQHKQHEDRFLRVKFTDERYKGKVMSSDDLEMSELYSRIGRAMTYGITIGDRHFEFLAFGSSQFREHGAYFFASTGNLTAAMIRAWMGNFSGIMEVAKYCARHGLCLSTTRAIPHSVTIGKISDVKHNGYNYTDGVGKISPLMARLIADHFKLPNTEQDYPSVFQFRMAGCKGILAVDPSLKGTEIMIRESQVKFPASYQGLEICRISQFSSAYLNMQLILVLSTLGVPDEVFVRKLREMLSEMSQAMQDERKASLLLQKNIDFNQMTLSLASMIYDGFMETEEPFFTTCLRLWRSWSLKYLKEKARLFVEQGAFVLGTTDETGTLKGHYDTPDDSYGPHPLPEIFLQIPNTEKPGAYQVVEGVCVLARNPSLHPGDVRVVMAVDVPALHHLKNCVVLPQNGDRDLANMCSGGDLDGDDYIIVWDKDLLPQEWNHAPMDYTSPPPVVSEGPVTVKAMAKFFVNHIKHDNLGRIAVAHRYWADSPDVTDCVKDSRCLELAQLHSKAVDYAKTGVPAEFPPHLKVTKWPHWSEPKNKSKSKVYQSKKILGQLYDEVKREPFHAAWTSPPDPRILKACEPSDQTLRDAAEVKELYDEALRRILAQHGIKTEFEVWTTFVLDHHQEIGDYKFAETIGEVAATLRQEYQELCYEKAGTDRTDRDCDKKMMPFLVAMYIVTANELGKAVEASKETVMRGGRGVQVKPMTFKTMPFISFPWLFVRELGQIATGGTPKKPMEEVPRTTKTVKSNAANTITNLLGSDFELDALPVVNTSEGIIHGGDLLDLWHKDEGDAPQAPPALAAPGTPLGSANELQQLAGLDSAALEVQISDSLATIPAIDRSAVPTADTAAEKVAYLGLNGVPTSLEQLSQSTESQPHGGPANAGEADAEESEEECEEVVIEIGNEKSSLDRLVAMTGYKVEK